MIGQHRQRAAAFPVPQHVHIVYHQRDRGGHRQQRRAQPGNHRTGYRAARGCQRLKHPLADRLHRVQRLRDVAEQHLRVVVGFVHRHPRKRLVIALSPLRQQRRLPVTRRRHHRDDRAGGARPQPLDQQRTTDGPGPDRRAADLRCHQVPTQPAHTLRPANPITPSNHTHAPHTP